MSWIRPLTLSLVLVAGPTLSHAGDLTTRDVVELARSGLGDDVLVALVEVDGGPFDLSPADLLDLRAEGLSDRVLTALLRAGRHGTPDAAFDEAPPEYDGAHSQSWMIADERYVARTVHVPFPVYIPVYQQPSVWPRRDGYRPDRVMKRRPSSPGLRHGGVTADSIRYAPPGFHPGTVRPRGRAAPDAPSTAAQSTAAPPPSTPGIARSTAGADRPPPGVARSQRSSRP